MKGLFLLCSILEGEVFALSYILEHLCLKIENIQKILKTLKGFVGFCNNICINYYRLMSLSNSLFPVFLIFLYLPFLYKSVNFKVCFFYVSSG